ncbi:unnamed protein product, partial [Hapterophycus canaliculatus]
MQIRAFGTSNASPYGITKMAQLGERLGYPRIASVQVTSAEIHYLGITISKQQELAADKACPIPSY